MLIPNSLTIGRAVLGPVFLAVFPVRSPLTDALCLAMAIAIEVSDVLDGHLARKRGTVSRLGKVLDPFADSVARFSVFLAFYAAGVCPLWVVAVLFYRDSLVLNLRMFAAVGNLVVSARPSGKLKAVVQGTCIIVVLALLVAQNWLPGLLPIAAADVAWWAMLLVGVVTGASGVDYTIGILRSTASEPAGD